MRNRRGSPSVYYNKLNAVYIYFISKYPYSSLTVLFIRTAPTRITLPLRFKLETNIRRPYVFPASYNYKHMIHSITFGFLIVVLL